MTVVTTDQIRDTEIELYNMRQRIRNVNSNMDAIKMSRVIDTETEWTKNKSPELSNQTKRNAIVDALLAADDTYIILSEEHVALEEDIALMSIDLNYIKRVEKQKFSEVDILPFADLNRIASALEQIAQRFPETTTTGELKVWVQQ